MLLGDVACALSMKLDETLGRLVGSTSWPKTNGAAKGNSNSILGLDESIFRDICEGEETMGGNKTQRSTLAIGRA